MPTASEYSSWAGALDEAARGPLTSAAAVRASWEAGPLLGGRERRVALVVDDVQDLVATAAVELAGLAEECRRRAAVCAAWTSTLAAHEQAVRSHRQALESLGAAEAVPSAPIAPARPAPWAEAGP